MSQIPKIIPGSPCKMFVLCNNPAMGYILHPVLGRVPSCERCATKLHQSLIKPEPVK